MNEQDRKEITISEDPSGQFELEKNPKKRKSDFLLKIISVLLAVLMWFWVVGFESQVAQRKFTSILVHTDNLTDMNLKYGYTILNNSEMYIDVMLEGKNSDLNRVKDMDLYAYVDLNEVTHAGEVTLTIKIKEMNDVEVVGQSQSRAIYYIDEEIITNFPVKWQIMQQVKEEGIEIGNISLTPEYVAVSGPKGVLQNLDHALVKLNLGTVERSLSITEDFVLIDKNGDEINNKYIKTNEATVNVEVPVTASKEVSLAVNYKYGYYNDKNTEIAIVPDKIQIKGSPDYIRSMDDSIIIGEINEKSHENDTILTFPIPLRDGVKNLNEITSADVVIKFIDMESKTINISTKRQNAHFNVVPPKDFEYHIKEDQVPIKVLGHPENLKSINSSKIFVNVDLSALSEKGGHPVPIEITVTSENNEVFCVGEYTVNVEIY